MEKPANEKSGTTTGKETGRRKWLNRIVKFLMYGGQIVVAALLIGVLIDISTC